MITLTDHLQQYIVIRRSFGYRLITPERVLRRFTEFADAQGISHVTSDLFLRWKDEFGSANNNTWSARLGMIRGFAQWLASIDPLTTVPPADLILGKARRTRPYIYTNEQVTAIVEEALKLPSGYGLRGLTCSTLFGLIAVTGLRVSEAIRLDDEDVDLDEAVVTVRRGKNGKSRFVPILPCTVSRLLLYRSERNRLVGNGTPGFFLFESGKRLTVSTAQYNFAQVCQKIGLRERVRFYKHGCGPRIHDLRHTFAVRTIVDWYRRGLDPDREMSKLSTYLGHAAPENTYWYIEAVPELLQLASKRAAHSMAKGGLK